MTNLQFLKIELEKLRLDATNQKHGRVYSDDVVRVLEMVNKMIAAYEAGNVYEYLNGERREK